MDNFGFPQSDFTFQSLDLQQQRIHKLLELIGPGPRIFYFDACRLMSLEPPLASRTLVVSHLLREIMGGMLNVLHTVSDTLEEKTGNTNKDGDNYKQKVRRCLKFLDIPEDDPLAKDWLELNLSKYAHRKGLINPGPTPEDNWEKEIWTKTQDILLSLLKRFEGKYADALRLVEDFIKKEKPSKEDIQQLRDKIPNSPTVLKKFFEGAHENWLERLRRYYFKTPPDIVFYDDNYGFWPAWPESQFLVRVTETKPQMVLEIAQQIPHTENPNVLNDLCDIALKLPIEEAAVLSVRLKDWLSECDHFYNNPYIISELIKRLTSNQKIEEASGLLRELFAVLPPQSLNDEIRSKHPAFIYREVLLRFLRESAHGAPVDFIIALRDLLSDAIQHLSESRGGQDPSQLWTPVYQEAGKYQIKRALIDALRTISETAIKQGTAKPSDIKEILEEKDWAIFRNLSKYLITGETDAPIITGVWTSDRSPVNANDLSVMSTDDLIEYLKTWQPSDRFVESKYGLRRELEKVVLHAPKRFADEIVKFKDVPPVYISALLSGLRKTAEEDKAFAWVPVLEFCRWVVESPLPSNDEDWEDVKQQVAWLLRTGFINGLIDDEYREQVWSIISQLLEKSPDLKGGPAELTNIEMQLFNLPRIVVLHAAMSYQFWLQRRPEEVGLAAEMKALLNPLLQVDSPALKAFWGYYVSYLYRLDSEWVQQNLHYIFVKNDDLWEAAWHGYIATQNRLYSENLAAFKEQYKRAISIVGIRYAPDELPKEADEHLAAHLMIFYLRGLLTLDSPDDLLTMFYETAPDILRAIGSRRIWMGMLPEPITDEIALRLRALWENRMEHGRSNPQNHSAELQTFGWWFASGKLDHRWSINQLKDVLNLIEDKQIGQAGDVIAQLARMAGEMPKDTVRCLASIIDRVRMPYEISLWKENIRAVLETALKSDAGQEARDLINRLAARGHSEFTDLLP